MGLLQEERIGAKGETTLMTCCLLSCTPTPPEKMSIPRRRKFFPFRADPFSAGSKNNWSSLPPLTVRVNQFPLLQRKAMICMSSCFFFFFFDLGFTALSRIFHLYRADRSSKVGENRRTRRKTT